MNKIDLVEKPRLRDDLPDFRPGDTVKVHARVVEAGRERIQVFQGVVIRRQGGGLRETFTARKISFGVGVERTFPVHSPSVSKIEVVQRGRVRRAKLYYLRELRGKRARIRERREAPGKAVVQAPAEEPETEDASEEASEPEEDLEAAVQPEGADPEAVEPEAEEPDADSVATPVEGQG